jgi:hypothetical protein
MLLTANDEKAQKLFEEMMELIQKDTILRDRGESVDHLDDFTDLMERMDKLQKKIENQVATNLQH